MDIDTLTLAAFELEKLGYTKAAWAVRQMSEKQGDPVGYAAGYQDGRKDMRAAAIEACRNAGVNDAEYIPNILGIVQLATNDCIRAIRSIG